MQTYGRAAISDLIGDLVVYRNLVPQEPGLPGLDELRGPLNLTPGEVPRKTSRNYARVMVRMLGAARTLRVPGGTIRRVVFIGDTRLNDATAFANICRSGGWSGQAFIGSEKPDPLCYEVEPVDVGAVFSANRWSALQDFAAYLQDQDFPVDERTAVLLDLDKTTLGARGRNDRLIDQARVAAAFTTARQFLGDDFDEQAFETAYHKLNQVEFHAFTADNQDYLVYICLMVSAGLFDLPDLVDDVRASRMTGFQPFIQAVEGRSAALRSDLRAVHQQVYEGVRRGDPTPFKAFRENEYRETAARLGHMPPGTPVADLLKKEIVLTQEVRAQALAWQRNGALLFGLSDKPDEASMPTPYLASQGALPIHRVITSVVGDSPPDL